MPFVLMNSKERFFRQPLFLKRWETISPMPFVRTNSEERYSFASLFLRERKEIFPMPFVLTNSEKKFSFALSGRYPAHSSKILDRKSLFEFSDMLLQ